MKKPNIFISYHRADRKYKNIIISILKEHGYRYFCIDENENFNGWKHQHIADHICSKMEDCEVLLCVVGKETFSRPHVDWEIHTALKGVVGERKGIVVVMLENRQDSKNDIDCETFPTKLQENLDYIVLEQFASIESQIDYAINCALDNRNDKSIQVTHKNPVMQLRSGPYFDN